MWRGLPETRDGTERPASLWSTPQFPYFITHRWLTRPSQMFYFQLFKFWPAFLSWMQKWKKKAISTKHTCQRWGNLDAEFLWGFVMSFSLSKHLFALSLTHTYLHYRYLADSLFWGVHRLAQGHFIYSPCIYGKVSKHPASPSSPKLAPKVSDACSEIPHKTCSHSSSSLRYQTWLIFLVFLLKRLLDCGVLPQSLMEKYIDNSDLFAHLL